MADPVRLMDVAQKLDDTLAAGAPAPGELRIKGLGEAVARVRSGILAARSAATGVDNAARAFVASANALAKQIDQAKADIEFEATQLGNSSGTSEV